MKLYQSKATDYVRSKDKEKEDEELSSLLSTSNPTPKKDKPLPNGDYRTEWGELITKI
ncbi:hypothetical protein [Vibrio parahaemolyticus]|uniref:hypothetical protein n=1 Tax=Vibrio parahaemolyticus TaxID=670 RepID=UPI0015DE21FF|nr:hypothetical protein [Vibrio parahaemolyticus]